MISNPVVCFVSGSDQVRFTYEGGTTLYHFSPHDCGLSTSLENNLIFFANDEAHALSVLRRMFAFVIAAKTEYIEHRAQHEEVAAHEAGSIKRFQGYIEALDAGKIELSLVPKDQFFIVSWASNDCVH